MDTPKRDKEKGLTIGLVAIIIVIVILALIGFFLLEPRTETIPVSYTHLTLPTNSLV